MRHSVSLPTQGGAWRQGERPQLRQDRDPDQPFRASQCGMDLSAATPTEGSLFEFTDLGNILIGRPETRGGTSGTVDQGKDHETDQW